MKTYTIEIAKKSLPKGWHKLVDRAFKLAENAKVKLVNIANNCGSIAIRTRASLPGKYYIEVIKLERESSETCMHCGRFGKIREAEEVTILCEDCWEAGVKLYKGQTKESWET